MTELYDWMVNLNNVRGSKANDNGNWLSASAKPKEFDPETRTLTCVDGKQYILNQRYICKVGKLELNSEATLAKLVSRSSKSSF